MARGCLCARALKDSHTCNPLKVWNPFLNPFPAKEFVLSFKNEFCKQATPARNVHFLEHGIFWAYAHSQNMSKESYDIFLADGKHFLVATVGCHNRREGVNVQLHIYIPGDLQNVQLVNASTTTTILQTHHSPHSVLVEYGKSCGGFWGWGWGVGWGVGGF